MEAADKLEAAADRSRPPPAPVRAPATPVPAPIPGRIPSSSKPAPIESAAEHLAVERRSAVQVTRLGGQVSSVQRDKALNLLHSFKNNDALRSPR